MNKILDFITELPIVKYVLKRISKFQQRKQLKRQKRFYELLQEGAYFIQFIQEDMKKIPGNRHQRRRMETDLRKKGVITSETVNFYLQKQGEIIKYIDARLNPPKTVKQCKCDNTK